MLVAADVPYTRMLLKQALEQQEWAATTAKDAHEALVKLQTSAPDLVIIDLNSFDNASEDLLMKARIAGHRLPVLLLCTLLDRDLLRRVANVAPVGVLTKPLNLDNVKALLPAAFGPPDQFLRKGIELSRYRPTTSDAKDTYGATQTVEEAISESRIDEDRIQKMFGAMPLLPHVVARILQLSGSDESTVKQLSDVVSNDPRMSGQLLRIVNSAYFGFARRIATIPEAMVILGTQAIRNLCLGAAVSSFFGGKSRLLDRMRLWRHSLAVATAARKIAERAGVAGAEEAFTAGLLHDFGRLALERHLSDAYSKAIEKARSEQVTLLQAEVETLNIEHAWLSGWMAAKWNLPGVLCQAMAYHHTPERANETDRVVAAAVHLGDILAHLGGLAGVEDVLYDVEPNIYASGLLRFDLDEVQDIIPEVQAETAALEQQLSVAMGSEG
ncbi:MAG: HDOD domain-containing protein [Fimbriimonadaceae bacterium]|nr:HDOD domain-containing protein [Fimbriimonadaceae bacterium]